MTKKHFEVIAKVLKKYNTCENTKKDAMREQMMIELVCDVAEALAQTNPRFDVARFIKACN